MECTYHSLMAVATLTTLSSNHWWHLWTMMDEPSCFVLLLTYHSNELEASLCIPYLIKWCCRITVVCLVVAFSLLLVLVMNCCTALCDWYSQVLSCIPLSLHVVMWHLHWQPLHSKMWTYYCYQCILLSPVYCRYVCTCQWVCICYKHGWCDAQLDIIHSYPSALMATVTKAYSYPPASNQLQSYSSWPTTSQLASAEPDFVSYMRQSSAGNVTSQFVHRKTSRCWVLDII